MTTRNLGFSASAQTSQRRFRPTVNSSRLAENRCPQPHSTSHHDTRCEVPGLHGARPITVKNPNRSPTIDFTAMEFTHQNLNAVPRILHSKET